MRSPTLMAKSFSEPGTADPAPPSRSGWFFFEHAAKARKQQQIKAILNSANRRNIVFPLLCPALCPRPSRSDHPPQDQIATALSSNRVNIPFRVKPGGHGVLAYERNSAAIL